MQPITFPDVLFHPCLPFSFLDSYAYFEIKELHLPTIFISKKVYVRYLKIIIQMKQEARDDLSRCLKASLDTRPFLIFLPEKESQRQ